MSNIYSAQEPLEEIHRQGIRSGLWTGFQVEYTEVISIVLPFSCSQHLQSTYPCCLLQYSGQEEKEMDLLGSIMHIQGTQVLIHYCFTFLSLWEKLWGKEVSFSTKLCHMGKSNMDKMKLFFSFSSVCLFFDFFLQQCAITLPLPLTNEVSFVSSCQNLCFCSKRRVGSSYLAILLMSLPRHLCF